MLIFSALLGALIPAQQFWSALDKTQIVYVGEQHDQAAHHEIQLQTIQHFDNPIIGLEMVAFSQQPVLDDYLSGKMSLADFERFWRQNWGYWEVYRPLLEYAKSRGLTLKGLNLPREIARQISRGGIASLKPEQRRLLPETIHPIADARYLEYVRKSAEEHTKDPARIGYIIEAQQAWNETMAESLAKLLPAGRPIVVIVGAGHVIYRAGIPASLGYRAQAAQTVVLPYPAEDEEKLRRPGGDVELGDYFWLLAK